MGAAQAYLYQVGLIKYMLMYTLLDYHKDTQIVIG